MVTRNKEQKGRKNTGLLFNLLLTITLFSSLLPDRVGLKALSHGLEESIQVLGHTELEVLRREFLSLVVLEEVIHRVVLNLAAVLF